MQIYTSLPILHYLFWQLIMNPTRSVGQGNIYSKLSQRITTDETSIIKRLTYPCLTGQDFQIQIHQHIWFELHLLWNVTSNVKKSSRCIEVTFSKYEELTDFCDKLTSETIEGMCDCVCVRVTE